MVAFVLDLIGNTPLIRLRSIKVAQIFVKAEFFNPTGSIKDRIALAMIEDAEKNGILKKDSIVVEPSSGNTAISLAMVCAVKGYKMVAVVPNDISIEKKMMVEAYGAKVISTKTNGLEGLLKKVEEMCEENPKIFMPNQFENPMNVEAHRKTGKEVLKQVDDKIDAFVAGVGTGGTLMGVGNVLKECTPDIKIVAVEPEESPVVSTGKFGPHKIEGIGEGFGTIVKKEMIDWIVPIKGNDAIKVTRWLARREGILVGISSGANVLASIKISKRLGKDKNIVTVLPDRGERYLNEGIFSSKED